MKVHVICGILGGKLNFVEDNLNTSEYYKMIPMAHNYSSESNNKNIIKTNKSRKLKSLAENDATLSTTKQY